MATSKQRSLSVSVLASPQTGRVDGRPRSVSEDEGINSSAKQNLTKFNVAHQDQDLPFARRSSSFSDKELIASLQQEKALRRAAMEELVATVAEREKHRPAAQIDHLHTHLHTYLHTRGASDLVDQVIGSIQQQAAEEAARQQAAAPAPVPAEKTKTVRAKFEEQLDEKVSALANLPNKERGNATIEVYLNLTPIEQVILCQRYKRKDPLNALQCAVGEKLESNNSASAQTSLPLGKDGSTAYPISRGLHAAAVNNQKAIEIQLQLQATAIGLRQAILDKYREIEKHQRTALFASFRKFKLDKKADLPTIIIHAATGGKRTRQALIDCFDKEDATFVQKQLNMIAASQKKNSGLDDVNLAVGNLVNQYKLKPKVSAQNDRAP